MAPYTLQWRLIQGAKAERFGTYDFWGIAGSDSPREPLRGVTRFKRGFGGIEMRFPGTKDLILRPWLYKLYRLLRFLRP
jgi:lipid II:glycine glycyltransferase (peptidoglycan interpeptide bridge formation enzyme)